MHPAGNTPLAAGRRRRTRRAAGGPSMAPLAAVLAGVLAIAVAAPAGATPTDTVDSDYTSGLLAQGITTPPAQLITAGHTICTTASGMATRLPARLVRMLPLTYTETMLGLPADQASTVVNAAFTAYCPQYLPQ